MSRYRQQLEDWLATLNVRSDRVIDIGGAQGNVDKRVHRWDVPDYRIFDLPDWDLNEDWGDIHTETADLIFCLEVFEYLINPLQALQNIKMLLRPNGVAYITAPLVYPVHQETEWDSLRYTENGFKRMCQHVGLEVKVIKYRHDLSGLLPAFYSNDGMHPAKGYDHTIDGYIFEVRK